MPTYEAIREETDGAIRVITLHRPKSLNAMNTQMVDELFDAFERAEADKDVRVIIITGSPRPDGRPMFSAGADIRDAAERRVALTGELRGSPPGEPLAHTLDSAFEIGLGDSMAHESRFHVLFATLERMRTPSIAAIDGICTTGGLELILCCDLRVVAETAQISDWHIKNLGSIGGAGATTRLPQLIGTARAKELLWTGLPVDGHEAVRIGLANRCYPGDKLLEGAKALAASIADKMPAAIAASKAVVNAAARQSPGEGVRYANMWGALIALQKEQGLAISPEPPIR